MPNIILNNYCNQKCSYCFANENMENKELQKEMRTGTFLQILQYLKQQKDYNMRILGWEPLLFKNLRKFLLIGEKWWFDTIIFSNINIESTTIKNIFSWIKNIRINCNINDRDFYAEEEQDRLSRNIKILQDIWVQIILWYNIIQTSKHPEFIFSLAEKHNIKKIHLKITNSSIGEKLLIDNSTRKLGRFLYGLIFQYHKIYHLRFSCGLSKDIFTNQELLYIKNNTDISLKFGCAANGGKFDINTDGSIFKCYPLQKIFETKKIHISTFLQKETSLSKAIEGIQDGLITKGECTWNKIIKNLISLP